MLPWRKSLIAIVIASVCAGKPAWAFQQPLNIDTTEVPPLASINPETPGFALELSREVLRASGYDGKVKLLPWSRAISDGKDDPNAIVVPISRLSRYEDDFIWIAPLVDLELTFVSADKPVDTLAQALELNTILVRQDSPYEAILRSYGFTNISTVTLGDFPRMLVEKRADAWFTSVDEAKWSWKNDKIAQPPVLGRSVGLQRMWLAGSKKMDQQVAWNLSATVAKMKQDGRFAAIMAKYFPPRVTESNQTLNVAAIDNGEFLLLQSMLGEFKELYPDIEVNLKLMSENEVRSQVSSDIFSGAGMFDVVAIGNYEISNWTRRGWLRPLDDLPPSYDVEDLIPSVRASLSRGGKLYALPFYAESSLTFYRKDLAAKAKITLPEHPDFNDLMRAAKAMNDPAHGVYGACLRGKPGWGENMALLSAIVNAHGGRWFDEAWHPDLKSAAWRESLAWYRSMLVNYGPPNPEKRGYNENLALFAKGKCGVWLGASVAAGTLFDVKTSSVAGKVGTVDAPEGVAGRGAGWLWSWAFAVPSVSTKADQARKFIQWATSKQFVRSVAARKGWVAVPPGTRLSTYADPDYLQNAAFAPQVLAAINRAAPTAAHTETIPYDGIQFVAIPEFQAIGAIAGQEIADYLTGKQSLEKALDRSDAKISKIMRTAGYFK